MQALGTIAFKRRGVREEDDFSGHPAYLMGKLLGDHSMLGTRDTPEDVYGRSVPQDLRDTARTELFEPQSRVVERRIPRSQRLACGAVSLRCHRFDVANSAAPAARTLSADRQGGMTSPQGTARVPTSRYTSYRWKHGITYGTRVLG